MPRKDRHVRCHYVAHVGPSGRGRARCGFITSDCTADVESVTCLVCLRALQRALRKREPAALVDDIIAEIRAGWGEESVNRGAVLTILLERILARQLTESGLILKLAAIDQELTARDL